MRRDRLPSINRLGIAHTTEMNERAGVRRGHRRKQASIELVGQLRALPMNKPLIQV
nr:hypothetical protein Q903MT_gene1528 [Picea sitchensis]